MFDLYSSAEDPHSLRTAALSVRELLDEFGMPSYVKTSGSKGFHILIPLDGSVDTEGARQFAHGVGAVLVKRHPHLLTQEFIEADRGDRIFVDTGETCRARRLPRCTRFVQAGRRRSRRVHMGRVDSTIGPRTFTLRTMAARIGEVGELWSGMADRACSPGDARAKLQTMLTDADWSEALAASTRRPASRMARARRPGRGQVRLRRRPSLADSIRADVS